MFIGHYGPAFALKPLRKPLPLWVLFLAVQWLDVGWALLVLAGVEKVRIVPGFTEASPLDSYYMPYTHGLLGALLLSGCEVGPDYKRPNVERPVAFKSQPAPQPTPLVSGRPSRSSSHLLVTSSTAACAGLTARSAAFWSQALTSQSAARAAGCVPPITIP